MRVHGYAIKVKLFFLGGTTTILKHKIKTFRYMSQNIQSGETLTHHNILTNFDFFEFNVVLINPLI